MTGREIFCLITGIIISTGFFAALILTPKPPHSIARFKAEQEEYLDLRIGYAKKTENNIRCRGLGKFSRSELGRDTLIISIRDKDRAIKLRNKIFELMEKEGYLLPQILMEKSDG